MTFKNKLFKLNFLVNTLNDVTSHTLSHVTIFSATFTKVERVKNPRKKNLIEESKDCFFNGLNR